jgi:hypothetical protein
MVGIRWYTVWLVPVVAHTVLRTPDDGCKEHPKRVEKSCSEIKYRLLAAASRWKLIYIRLVMHGTMNVKSEIFWYFMQRKMVVRHWRFGTTHRYHLQGSMKMGPYWLPQNVGKKNTIILGCVKSQTSADLIYTAAVASKQVNAICAKNHPKPVNTLCKQNSYFLCVNALCTVHAGNHALTRDYGPIKAIVLPVKPARHAQTETRTPSEHIPIRRNTGHSTCAAHRTESSHTQNCRIPDR